MNSNRTIRRRNPDRLSAGTENFGRRGRNSALRIEYFAVNELQPYQNNPRKHPKSQIDKLAGAIRDFGFVIPILIDAQKTLVAGHARLEAAKTLALPTAPCIRVSHLTEAQKRTFTILDNRLAEDAVWDFQLLAKEIEFLQDDGVDLQTTGFEIPEIEMIFDSADPPASNSADDKVPNPAPNRIVTKPNDLWVLGDHRLLCGDARRRESFAILLSGKLAQLIFVDPPYNVKIRGHVSGKGRIQHREFLQASGEKTSAQFTKFLEDFLGTSCRAFDERLDSFRLF